MFGKIVEQGASVVIGDVAEGDGVEPSRKKQGTSDRVS